MAVLKKMRFWVQNVLPQVYDDSLSYYELVNKVVAYLNDTIDEVNRLEEWASGVDFTDAVDEVLREMMANGEFDEYISEYVSGMSNVVGSGMDTLIKEVSNDVLAEYSSEIQGMRATDIYSLYDAIPNLQKHVYGADSVGNDLVYYTYDAPIMKGSTQFDSYRSTSDGLPFLMLVSGIHGDEHGCVITTYLIVKELLSNPGKYSSIVQNVGMCIVPVANPSGFNVGSRLNSNGVNINRNFPYGFSAGGESGAAALDQPESAFLASLVDTYHATWKSGLFVVDNHEFLDSGAVNRMFWFNCSSAVANYPEVRYNLLKSAGYALQKILAKYPELAPREGDTEYNQFLQISGTDATFESYFARKGCSGFLCESRSQIRGGEMYTVQVLWIDFMIRSNAIWSTFANFKTYAKKTINSLTEIGLDETASLSDVISAVPYRSKLIANVPANSRLLNDMPSIFTSCTLEVQKVPGGKTLLKAYTFSDNGDATITCISRTDTSNNVKPWMCETPLGLYQLYPGQLTLENVKRFASFYPAQITFVTAGGGSLNIPNEGLLIILKPFIAETYQHIWLININGGCDYVNVAHITPASESVTWKRLETAVIE